MREDAWKRAGGELKRLGRADELERVRSSVSRWVSGESSGLREVFAAGSVGDGDDPQARLAAMPPIMDAALAIVAADLLDQDERYALSKPWRSALYGQAERPRSRRPATRSGPA